MAKSFCSFCLGYVMQHANSSEGYVLSKVSSVAAQLVSCGGLLLLLVSKFLTHAH